VRVTTGSFVMAACPVRQFETTFKFKGPSTRTFLHPKLCPICMQIGWRYDGCSVRFPIRHQSTPILHVYEIIDKLKNKSGSTKFRVTHSWAYKKATGNGIGWQIGREIGQRIGCDKIVRVDARFSCRTENRISIQIA
jgi:hypothetical protein